MEREGRQFFKPIIFRRDRHKPDVYIKGLSFDALKREIEINKKPNISNNISELKERLGFVAKECRLALVNFTNALKERRNDFNEDVYKGYMEYIIEPLDNLNKASFDEPNTKQDFIDLYKEVRQFWGSRIASFRKLGLVLSAVDLQGF